MREIRQLGLCQCGCGQATKPARQTDNKIGNIAGVPVRYVLGHNVLLRRPPDEAVTIDGDPCFKVPLTKGYFTIVDAADYERVRSFTWYSHVSRRLSNGDTRTVYAYRVIREPGHRRRLQPMHRFLLDSDVEVDHRNSDGLDNRRINLRSCTHADNCSNVKRRITNTSGFKGVSWDASRRKWRADIGHNHKTITLGRFDDIKQAVLAYNEAAVRLHGEFARLNEVA